MFNASSFIRQLRASDPGALDELRRMAISPLERLAARYADLTAERASDASFIQRGLIFCRLWLYHLTPVELGRLDDTPRPADAVRAAVQVALARYFSPHRAQKILEEYPSDSSREVSSTSLVGTVPRFRVELSFKPLEDVGGDFFDVSTDEDPLRVVVGDVAGHGWLAFLVAEGCRRLIGAVARETPRPEAVLERLHAELRPVLPEGLYVEISITLIERNGTAHSAFSGRCWRLHCRQADRTLNVDRLGGLFVGLNVDWSEDSFEACECQMDDGDELVLGSDGVFEQLTPDGRMLASRLDELATTPLPAGTSLHDLVWGLYESAAEECPPKDDATLLSVRRRPPTCDECPEHLCPDLAERQLLSAHLKESPAAESLYRLLCDKVRRSVLQIVPNDADADDVLQIAFFRLIRKLHQWKHDCPLCLFFRVIAVREALRVRESQRNRRTVELDDRFEVAGGGAVSLELRECLETKARSFPVAWREVLRMKLDGVPHDQIAKALGIRSRATIQTWLARMREVFRDCVG